MASLTVYGRTGEKVGTYEIEPTDIAPHINKQLLHDAVVMYQANARQGSAKTKSRAEVAGSSQKMYRQKGTGRARAGSRLSGIRRGGGHIHAKRPRNFGYRLPRKALRLATRMAVASKIMDNEITVVDELAFDAPATKQMAGVLKAVGCGADSVQVATAEHDVNVYMSGRNIKQVSVSQVSDLNASSVLSSRRLLVTKAALDVLKSRAAADSESSAS